LITGGASGSSDGGVGGIMTNNNQPRENQAAHLGTPSDTKGQQIGGTGGGGAHNNVQPTIIQNFIIKT
jgi:microcystin-dependent protein